MKPTEKMTRAERVRANGGTPNSELRELVEEWRDKADTLSEFEERYGIDNWGEVGQIEILADELEAVLPENASAGE